MKARRDPCGSEFMKERLHEGLIHGASAIRSNPVPGRSDLRVASRGMYCRDRLEQGSVESSSGTYNNPFIPPLRALFVDNVCIFCWTSRDSTLFKPVYWTLDSYNSTWLVELCTYGNPLD